MIDLYPLDIYYKCIGDTIYITVFTNSQRYERACSL